jgi:hypothetical protein
MELSLRLKSLAHELDDIARDYSAITTDDLIDAAHIGSSELLTLAWLRMAIRRDAAERTRLASHGQSGPNSPESGGELACASRLSAEERQRRIDWLSARIRHREAEFGVYSMVPSLAETAFDKSTQLALAQQRLASIRDSVTSLRDPRGADCTIPYDW